MQQSRVKCLDLNCQKVKVITAGCTTETSSFEAYSGKTVHAKGYHVISLQKDTLFLGRLEVDQNPSITNQEWIKQQSQDHCRN